MAHTYDVRRDTYDVQYRCVGDGRVTIEAVGSDGPPPVECLMTPLEPLCYEVAADFLPAGARAAEVGCFKGGSACILWHAMRRRGKDVSLTCHDLFVPFEQGGEVHDIEAAFDANTAAWGVRATKARGDSGVTHAVHSDGSLDYCFVDGDHSFEGALADICNFVPKLKADGWLLIQDCIGEVQRAVEAAEALRGMTCMLISPPYAHYVTVCHRRPEMIRAYEARLRAVMEAAHAQAAAQAGAQAGAQVTPPSPGSP